MRMDSLNIGRKGEKQKPTILDRRDVLKFIGAAGLGLAASQIESVFSQQPHRLSKGTEKRERRVYKIVNLDQILELIRTTNNEHAYFRTNKNKPGEYLKYPHAGGLSDILIKTEDFPIEDGVTEVTDAHTHRVHGSIREQFRTMPPYPQSFLDWRRTVIETEKFAKRGIKLSTEVIELTGIWHLNFEKTEKTEAFLEFLKEEQSLRDVMLPREKPDDQLDFISLVYLFRTLDTNSEIFQNLWKREAFRETILRCQQINLKLKEKYPEVFADTKRILEIQNEIMATANTNDRNKRSMLVREYAAIAGKYGFNLEYKPF